MYDGIQYRGYGQEIVETLAEYAGVPVWNGLTNEFHPTQLLADLLTMQEHLPGKAFNEMTLVYAGDARNNMGNSMLEAASLTGLDLRLVAPQACWPEAALVAECSALAQKHGGKITLTEDIASGVKGADFIYTDVWVSMGEPKEKWAERIALLRDYQVNSKMMALTVIRRLSSSTVCLHFMMSKPRWVKKWPQNLVCMVEWKSPMKSLNLRQVLSLTRQKTGCTP